MTIHCNRRAIAVVAPIAAITTATGAAQTPQSSPDAASDPLGLAAQVEAIDPADLLATLLAAEVGPMTSENFTPFKPVEWPVEEGEELPGGAPGGVLIIHADASQPGQESVLGGYLVLDSAGAATAALEEARQAASGDHLVMPAVMAGCSGFTSEEDDYADTYLQVGNVLVIAADAFFTDGARLHATDSVFRSIVHAVSLLDHLDSVTRPEDDR